MLFQFKVRLFCPFVESVSCLLFSWKVVYHTTYVVIIIVHVYEWFMSAKLSILVTQSKLATSGSKKKRSVN